MITAAELHRRAVAESLRFDQVEKDYIILWILYGLSRPQFAPKGWVLKGGTCLRHCYYRGYRFSEDLDFSCLLGKDLDAARELLDQVAVWIQGTSGIRMKTKNPHTIPGDFQVEIPMEYSRGGQRTRGLPCVKIHLTSDEPIQTKMMSRSIAPHYSDLSRFKIHAYGKEEIVAEKMRALIQQQKKWPRPRDLYDLWFILCHSEEKFQARRLRSLFIEKCRVRQIQSDTERLTSETLRAWNKDAWKNQLEPLMKTVLQFDKVWQDWIAASRKVF